ncbi:hypothetical protein ACC699_37630, partial [Rhizobium ruizarguesonis]
MKAFFVFVLSAAALLSGISAESQAIDSRGFEARPPPCRLQPADGERPRSGAWRDFRGKRAQIQLDANMHGRHAQLNLRPAARRVIPAS